MSTQKNEHNPDNLTPEQYGAPEWRLLNHGEPQQLGDEWWNDIKQCWEPNDESDVGFSYNHHAARRRITPPADTTGSGREGETPELAEAMERGRRAGVAANIIAEYSQHILSLERQRDAAIAQVEALRRDRERDGINYPVTVDAKLLRSLIWTGDAIVREPNQGRLAAWRELREKVCAQMKDPAIDSAQRQEKP